MIYTISSNDNTIRWGLTGPDRIVQNVLNIIRTKKYEVPFMRGLGIDPEYIDNKLSYIQSEMTEDIIDTVAVYEDRATIVDVRITGADENGNLIYTVDLEV